MSEIKLGCHVGMAGKDMFLASAREAASYGANVFMLYTGAPQNTRRKDISNLNIDAGWEYAHEHGIDEITIQKIMMTIIAFRPEYRKPILSLMKIIRMQQDLKSRPCQTVITRYVLFIKSTY